MHFSFKSLWAHEIRVHNNGSNPSECILCVQNIKLKLKVFHFNFLLWCHMQGCLQNFFIEVAIWRPLKILGWHPNNRMSCFIVLLSNIGHSKIMIKKREKELYAQLMTWGLTGQIWAGGWPVIRQANPRWRPWSWSQNYENGHTLCLRLKLQMVTDSTEASYFLMFQVFVLRCHFLSVHSLNTQTWKKHPFISFLENRHISYSDTWLF